MIRRRLDGEIGILALGLAALGVAFLILNQRTYFWGDEVLTSLLVSLPTPGRMLTAIADQADNSPPLFFLVAWVWARIAGTSEVSLRLLSCLGIMLALVVTWRTLRRAYPAGATALGTLAAFCLPFLLIGRLREARGYGLFMLLAALALWIYARRAVRPGQVSWGLTGAQALVHAGLVLVHYFGPLYSAIFLLATVVADVRRRLFHPRLYGAVLVGWLAFLPWLEIFQRHRQTGNPHSWIPLPTLRELLYGFSNTLPLSLLLLSWWWVALMMQKAAADPGGTEPAPAPEAELRLRTDLQILAVLLICIPPVVAWVVSHTLVSVFSDRYFVPGFLGWAVVLSSLAHLWFPGFRQVTWPLSRADLRRQLPALLLAGQLLAPLAYAVIWPVPPRHQEVVAPGSPALPVVVPAATEYLERVYYSPTPERYYFLLDWEAAVSRDNSLGSVDDYHNMSGVKRHFPHLRIVPWTQFLDRYEQFLVLDDKEYTWFEMRLQCNPHFRHEYISENVILVRKIQRKDAQP